VAFVAGEGEGGAARFPEIGWKLPPKRKPWESEHYSMSIFEALETAVTYLS
jgi:hypothetical protein